MDEPANAGTVKALTTTWKRMQVAFRMLTFGKHLTIAGTLMYNHMAHGALLLILQFDGNTALFPNVVFNSYICFLLCI